MALTRRYEAGGGPPLEPGTYKVRCLDIGDDVLENPKYGSGDIVRFKLEVTDQLDEEGNPIELDAIANDKLTPKSKLTRWLEAFGITGEAGDEIDLEQVIDCSALAKVIAQKDDSGKETGFVRVEDLMPLPKAPARRNGRASAPSTEPTAPSTQSISDWWRTTRDENFDRDKVISRSQQLFDNREPAFLTPKELDELLVALRGRDKQG